MSNTQDKRTGRLPSHMIATYSCSHEVLFKKPIPSVGEELLCLPCAKAVVVVKLSYLYSYHCVTCFNQGKHANRYFKNNKEQAKEITENHVRVNPGHTIQLKYGNQVIDTITNENQITLYDIADLGNAV